MATVVATIGWTSAVVVTVALLAASITAAFDRQKSRRKRLSVIVVAYSCVTMSFAGVYYAMAANSDLDDADEALSVRTHEILSKVTHKAEKELGLPVSQDSTIQLVNRRAFSGLPKLYSVDDTVGPINLATRLAVMADCLHYSIVTITTTGFGDIVPRVWYATLLTDVEILMGIALLIVALNAGR